MVGLDVVICELSIYSLKFEPTSLANVAVNSGALLRIISAPPLDA